MYVYSKKWGHLQFAVAKTKAREGYRWPKEKSESETQFPCKMLSNSNGKKKS